MLLLVMITMVFGSGALLFAEGVKEYTDIPRKLTVLHTNDFHGHPLKFYDYPADGLGGLPAIATFVKQVRGANQNVLVLDAGDLNTGRPESNFFKAEPDILGYNYIGY
ncbi:MAG: bifunctional metallophosphatase/5'-nucleotidase, partial [Spirochaetales bacterium]